MGIPQGLAPTLTNILNILLQVAISYPTMKFIIMKWKGLLENITEKDIHKIYQLINKRQFV